MGEIKNEVRYGPYMTGNNIPAPFVASASQSAWGAFRAFSESLEDDLTLTGLGAGKEQWVQIQLDVPIRIWALRICGRTTVSAKDAGQVPKNFTIQGSVDGQTFEHIQTFTDVSWDKFVSWNGETNQYNWADGKLLELVASKEYQYYRFSFEECQNITTQKTGISTPTPANTVKITLIDLYQITIVPDKNKYLLQDDAGFYTVRGQELQAVPVSRLTPQAFRDYGIDADSFRPDWIKALKNPQIHYFQETDDLPVKQLMVSARPKPQVVYSGEWDMTQESIKGIKAVVCSCSEDIQAQISFDKRHSWWIYDGGWKLAQGNSGMTKAQLEGITTSAWDEKAVTGSYEWKILLPNVHSFFNYFKTIYQNS